MKAIINTKRDQSEKIMKVWSLMVMFVLSITVLMAQNDSLTGLDGIEVTETIADNYEDGYVESEQEKYEKPTDSSVVEVGNKLYIFLEYDERFVIDKIDLNTGEKKRVLDLGCKDCEGKKDTTRFRGHWSGFEIGINQWMNNDFSLSRPDGYDYMKLNTWKSWNVNINFLQVSIPRKDNRVGLVTGLGLEMNRYNFENDNSIQVNETTGMIEERVLEGTYDVIKSKFNTMYLTMPLLIEAQLGNGRHYRDYYISAGVVGGVLVRSSIKVKHENNGHKQKLIERGDDMNLGKYRLGATMRLGNRDKNGDSSGFYATYYFTTLFEKDSGPELYPFEVGFRIDI